MPATQPGHWFRPVTKPGKINNKKRGFLFLKNSIFADLFTGARVRNITALFGLHNIYQRQSWKYS
jgi:hypothetical protein